MKSRGIVLCALLSGTGVACINASQPRSPKAARDHVAAALALSTPSPEQRRRDLAAETPDVEVVPVAGSRLGRVRATVVIRAPVDRVHAILVDFPRYPEFLPNYKSAKVVGTTPRGGTLVHMQIDALGGIIRRWMRVEMSPPTVVGLRESFDAHLVEGDVKAFEARWVLDRLEEGGMRLTLESFLDADLTLPAAFIDAGSASGLKDAILAIKARAEDGVP